MPYKVTQRHRHAWHYHTKIIISTLAVAYLFIYISLNEIIMRSCLWRAAGRTLSCRHMHKASAIGLLHLMPAMRTRPRRQKCPRAAIYFALAALAYNTGRMLRHYHTKRSIHTPHARPFPDIIIDYYYLTKRQRCIELLIELTIYNSYFMYWYC